MEETPLNKTEEKNKKIIKKEYNFFQKKKDYHDEYCYQEISHHQGFGDEASEDSFDLGEGDDLQVLFENKFIIENKDYDSVVNQCYEDFDDNQIFEDEVCELSRA